jgi:hypothetical protein
MSERLRESVPLLLCAGDFIGEDVFLAAARFYQCVSL